MSPRRCYFERLLPFRLPGAGSIDFGVFVLVLDLLCLRLVLQRDRLATDIGTSGMKCRKPMLCRRIFAL